MGRYIIDNPEPPGAMEQFRGNVNRLGQTMLQLKMAEIERKRKQEDELSMLREKAQIEQESPLGVLEQRSKLASFIKDTGQDATSEQMKFLGINPPQVATEAPQFGMSANQSMSPTPSMRSPILGQNQMIPESGTIENTPFGQRMKDVKMFSPEVEKLKKQMDIEKATKIEEMKPYSADEIKIASGVSLIPQIDKLINLVESKDVYEGVRVPFGGSRISAFGEKGAWNTIKRGMTAGPGREAGLILQDIKQIMFATGGQALTDPEILKLGPKMEPAYKTEKQWIADLKDVKQRIKDKVRMMRPNPASAEYGINQRPTFGQKSDFASESEAQAANLPDGMPITINGVPGKWRNE